MKHTHPFTLIEVLVSIAIVVILAGILVGGISFASQKADNAHTRANMEQLAAALEEFRAANGFYPLGAEQNVKVKANTTDKKLVLVLDREWTLGRNPGFDDLDASAKELTDAWGNALLYKCPGSHNKKAYDLWSNGKDETRNTEDDITNWENFN